MSGRPRAKTSCAKSTRQDVRLPLNVILFQRHHTSISVRRNLTKAQASARERLLTAAYELFATRGINQVGIDTILANSGCAKASFYGNFKSKLDLAIGFLDRREQVWTRDWL